MTPVFDQDDALHPPPPATRFQGSKHKLLGWIWGHLRDLPFQTCLDAFAGSGTVAHHLKGQGKAVTVNDTLKSSYLNGLALVENQEARLSEAEIERVISAPAGAHDDDLIARTFEGIYFMPDENVWLDRAAQAIPRLRGRFKQALAWHALFQSTMAKRPYNLFHRRNLYMRLAPVVRTFGNKATWDKPFGDHFRQFAAAANAAVFRGALCHAINEDAINLSGEFDLVYIDPPYLNRQGVGVDYHGFYHFLEGLADYGNWAEKIDFSSKHRRLQPVASPWTNRRTIHRAFADLFDRHRRSILAVSYRSDGIPTLEELAALIKGVKKNVRAHTLDRAYKYALSTNSKSSEALLIGWD